jgi:hypothetical protein
LSDDDLEKAVPKEDKRAAAKDENEFPLARASLADRLGLTEAGQAMPFVR